MSNESKTFSVLFAGGGTAGHLLPALATQTALERILSQTNLQLNAFYLATKLGAERRILTQQGADFRIIPKVDFPRGVGLRTLTFIPRLVIAVLRTISLARKADVVVGFGGYVALPAYIAARIVRKPLVIHEANAVPGLANRLGRVLATFTLTNFPIQDWRNSKSIGLPIRDEIWRIGRLDQVERDAERNRARENFGLDINRKTILVFGGSLGAAKLNSVVENSVDELLNHGFQVLHSVGPTQASKELTDAHKRIGYFPVPYISEMDQAYLAADIVIARSGAGTCAEIAATGIPALLVPLAIGNGEQGKNAEQLLGRGNIRLIKNEELTSVNLLAAVDDLSQEEIVPLQSEHSAAHELAETILNCGRLQ